MIFVQGGMSTRGGIKITDIQVIVDTNSFIDRLTRYRTDKFLYSRPGVSTWDYARPLKSMPLKTFRGHFTKEQKDAMDLDIIERHFRKEILRYVTKERERY